MKKISMKDRGASEGNGSYCPSLDYLSDFSLLFFRGPVSRANKEVKQAGAVKAYLSHHI